MTPEEIKKMVGDLVDTALAGKTVPAASTAAPAPVVTKKSAEPVLPENPTSDDLRNYRLEVRKHNIIKNIDPSKPESIEKAEKDLAAIEKEIKDGVAPAAEAPAAENAVKKAAPSNQTAAEIAKAQAEADEEVTIGKQMAEISNKSRGFAK